MAIPGESRMPFHKKRVQWKGNKNLFQSYPKEEEVMPTMCYVKPKAAASLLVIL